jgi:hypothetical protein
MLVCGVKEGKKDVNLITIDIQINLIDYGGAK